MYANPCCRKPERPCGRCGKSRLIHAKGMCHNCYAYQRRAAAPTTGVGRGGPGVRKTADDIAARLEDFLILVKQRGLSQTAAARELEISVRTAVRLARRARDQGVRL